MHNAVSLDCETSKSKFPWKDDYYLSCISTYEPNGRKTSFVFVHDEQEDIHATRKNKKKLQKILNNYDIIIGHNLKFDLIQLKHLGIDLNKHHFFCTMVAKYLIQYHMSHSLSLNDCARIEGLTVKDDRIKTMWESGYETHQIPLELLLPYCEHDAYLAYQLACRYIHRLRKKGLSKNFGLSMEFMDMLADMEINGLKFDIAKAQQLVARYQKLVNVLESKLKKIAADCLHPEVIDEFNPRSTRELSVLFYGGEIKRRKRVPKITEKNVKVRMPYIFVYKNGDKRIKLRSSDHPRTKCLRYVFADVPYYSKGLAIQPLPKTETSWAGYFSTDKSVIEQLQAHETNGKMAIKICLKISKINKMLETFQGKSKGSGLIAKVDSNGFLHTNYNQARTGTGRLSSSDPNNQNLPRAGTSPIKTCIVPRFDQIVDADLSQIELVVPTQYSQDPVMLHENNTGIDRHDRTRKDLMKLPKTKQNRVYAKIFNFRMIYRGSPWGFFKDPHMPRFKLKQWEQVVKDYWKKYKVFDQWHKQIIAHVIQGDGTLQTPLGRWYKFKMFNGKYNEHQIVNYPIQGTAGADILPLCAVLIHKELKKLKLKSIPVLTVHDSIVFDCPANEVDTVADITMHVFNNTDSYISQYFGVNWIAKITGEVEAGDNYGSTTQIR